MSSINLLNFATCKVLDELGKEVAVGTLWQKQTAVFIFLRHFACIACRGHAAQVWREREKYEKSGARIFFIGNGDFHFIKTFKEDLGITAATVYTDPTLEAFMAAGFRRGFLAALGPKSLVNAVKLVVNGHVQVGYQKGMGDLWQLGGIVVVKQTGHLAYHYISEVLGDYPPANDVGAGQV